MIPLRALGLAIGALTASLTFFGSAAAQTRPAAAPQAQAQQFGSANFGGDVDVRGAITAHSLRLTPKTADFVFRDDYRLRTLAEVEKFIRANRHLPEVPSEKEMVSQGVAVETLNGLYLQKIEELTLYLIEQNREVTALRDRIARLEGDGSATSRR